LPAILTAVPDKLVEQNHVAPVDVRLDALAALVAGAGTTASASPAIGFSLAVSGMITPPSVRSSSRKQPDDLRSLNRPLGIFRLSLADDAFNERAARAVFAKPHARVCEGESGMAELLDQSRSTNTVAA
jgi:hypothetical protein